MKIKEIKVHICDGCGKKFENKTDAKKHESFFERSELEMEKIFKKLIGCTVKPSPYGIEMGYSFLGRMKSIIKVGHERGIIIHDYITNSNIKDIYSELQQPVIWEVIDEDEINAWRKLIKEDA